MLFCKLTPNNNGANIDKYNTNPLLRSNLIYLVESHAMNLIGKNKNNILVTA